jgi:plastocyanin
MRLAARAVRLTLAAFALLLIGMASAANAAPSAATTAVSIQGFAFNPTSVTINAGDSVRWTNLDGSAHSAVAQGSFNTGTLGQNQTATIAFNTAGTFAYICGIHGSSMSGSVTVRAAATPAPTTVAPTPVPTPQPTVAPTPRPTLAPTPQPTVAATAEPTIAPTPAVSAVPATSAPVATASLAAAASVTPSAGPTLAAKESGPGPLIVAGAAVIIVVLGGLAWVLLRR